MRAGQRWVGVVGRVGQVATSLVGAVARGLRGVPAGVETKFLDAVGDQLPNLSVKGVKVLVAQTLDYLHPEDREAQEQTTGTAAA